MRENKIPSAGSERDCVYAMREREREGVAVGLGVPTIVGERDCVKERVRERVCVHLQQ